MEFEKYINVDELCELPDVFEIYIKEKLGGLLPAPISDIDKFNLIRNFSPDPVLDINGKDIIIDPITGIPYKSSGSNPLYHRRDLDSMHNQGISGTNTGGKRIGAGSFP